MGWLTKGRSTVGKSLPQRPNPKIPTTGGKGHGCTSASERRNKKR
jgi:hypothetical protein